MNHPCQTLVEEGVAVAGRLLFQNSDPSDVGHLIVCTVVPEPPCFFLNTTLSLEVCLRRSPLVPPDGNEARSPPNTVPPDSVTINAPLCSRYWAPFDIRGWVLHWDEASHDRGPCQIIVGRAT